MRFYLFCTIKADYHCPLKKWACIWRFYDSQKYSYSLNLRTIVLCYHPNEYGIRSELCHWIISRSVYYNLSVRLWTLCRNRSSQMLHWAPQEELSADNLKSSPPQWRKMISNLRRGCQKHGYLTRWCKLDTPDQGVMKVNRAGDLVHATALGFITTSSTTTQFVYLSVCLAKF